MNIFVLDYNPSAAAKMHCDKHVVKMIVESAQMLSTAHRVLNGSAYKDKSKSGKRLVTKYSHPTLDSTLYQASHINHPCNVWVRESYNNYFWLYILFRELCFEYTHRYGKKHKSSSMLTSLYEPPKGIPIIRSTNFVLAMPDEYKTNDPVESYRNFYIGAKKSFAKWTKTRPAPSWWE